MNQYDNVKKYLIIPPLIQNRGYPYRSQRLTMTSID